MKIKLTWTDEKGSIWILNGEGNVNLITSEPSSHIYTFGSLSPTATVMHATTTSANVDFETWEMTIIPPATITEDPLP